MPYQLDKNTAGINDLSAAEFVPAENAELTEEDVPTRNKRQVTVGKFSSVQLASYFYHQLRAF